MAINHVAGKAALTLITLAPRVSLKCRVHKTAPTALPPSQNTLPAPSRSTIYSHIRLICSEHNQWVSGGHRSYAFTPQLTLSGRREHTHIHICVYFQTGV